ncbi:MAG TPA: hypothetical protein VF618_18715 [Thermoanaerobaculia bacterium]
MTRLLALLLSLVATHSYAGRWIVPAAAHATGGAGTNWKTELRLVNPSGAPATACITLLRSNSDNRGATSVAIDVPAAGQAIVADILETKFATSGTGALAIDSTSALVVSSRTYNEVDGATYGQYLPGVRTEDALGAGETGHLIYLTKSDAFRTNVGFASTTEQPATVTITLFDAANLNLGTRSLDLAPLSHMQLNDVFGVVGAPAANAARAEVKATAPIVAYASVVDNRTGDPVAVMAQRANAAAQELVIAAAAHLDGAGGSAWRSDVRLYNSGASTATVTLALHARGASGAPSLTTTLAIPPRQLLVLDDVIAKTFGQMSAMGGLRITSSQKLLAVSRTYNDTPNGTYGQDAAGVAIASALTIRDDARFAGLTTHGYRANLGIFNLAESAAELTLTLRGSNGTVLGTRGVTLEASQMTQLDDVFSYVGVPNAESASLAITTTARAASYAAYVSQIDNRSGDAIYIPAVVAAANAAGGDCVTVPFMRAGLKFTYVTTANDGGTSTRVGTFLTDTATRQEATEKVTTAGFVTEIDSFFDFTVANDLRQITRAISKSTTSVSGFVVNVNTDSTFTPAMPIAPASTWCAGQTWSIPAVAQRVIVTGISPSEKTINRPAATGEVLAVNESVTTAAGTFLTVKVRGVNGATDPDLQQSTIWYSVEHGLVVKEESAGGRMELTQLQ